MSRPAVTAVLALLIVAFAAAAPAAAASARERRAESLVARARIDMTLDTFEGRRAAMMGLEEATRLVPERPEWELTLARLYMRCGFMGLARHRFEKVHRFAPGDADACVGLGQVWRHDWLKYLDLESRDAAAAQFRAAADLAPGRADASIMLVPILLESGDPDGAARAAQRAVGAEPGRLDALLADACASYRLGRLAHADSGFRRAIPRLPRSIRDRFEDIRPVASERDTLTLHRLWPAQAAQFRSRFWRKQDPDPVSGENEAQLEYWARVTHAYLLYYDARRQIWDERGEMYVRYGAPERQIYNDIGDPLAQGLTPGSRVPMNVLTWDYPKMGMRIRMQDRMLNGFYLPELQVGLRYSMIIEPEPDPDSLARHPELFGTGDGRGVFPVIPPGTRRLPMIAEIARFEGDGGPRLLADLEVAGGPEDSLFATWVIQDSNEVEVTRATRPLSPSACDPTAYQVADFARELSPGDYLVGMTVSGANRARGVHRERIRLFARDSVLALSDLMVSCGVPDAASFDPMRPVVRIEPNPGARVREGDPLTAYFEIAHMRPDADGMTRFELEYQVRSVDRDARIWIQRLLSPRPTPAPLRAARIEQQLGATRRQFLSIPLQAMPAGRYRLEIRVRDLVAGTEAEAAANFVHEPAALSSGAASGAGSLDGR